MASPLPAYKEPKEKARCLVKLDDLGALGAMDSAGDRAVYACPISPNGKVLATGHQTGALKLWRVDTGECVHDFCSTRCHGPERIHFSPDGTLLLTGVGCESVELWDVETGKSLKDLEGHDGNIEDLQFSQDGKMIISASGDCTARLWCIETYDCVHVLDHPDWVLACCFSPDGTLVATGSEKTVRIWRVDTGECIHVLEGHIEDVTTCRFSPDSKLVVSGCNLGDVRVWCADTGKCVHFIEDKHTGAVTGCEFSPNGKLVATFGGGVLLWRLDTSEILHELGDSKTRACAFSPDGALLVAGEEIDLMVYRVDTGKLLNCFVHEGMGESITDCHFSPDGRVITSSSEGTNGHICLWGPFV